MAKDNNFVERIDSKVNLYQAIGNEILNMVEDKKQFVLDIDTMDFVKEGYAIPVCDQYKSKGWPKDEIKYRFAAIYFSIIDSIKGLKWMNPTKYCPFLNYESFSYLGGFIDEEGILNWGDYMVTGCGNHAMQIAEEAGALRIFDLYNDKSFKPIRENKEFFKQTEEDKDRKMTLQLPIDFIAASLEFQRKLPTPMGCFIDRQLKIWDNILK